MESRTSMARSSEQLAQETIKKGLDKVKVIKDANQFEHEVINLDHPDWAPTSGMVEIFPLKVGKGINGAKRHANDVSFSVVRDREAGFLIGITNGIDNKSGDLKFDKVVIKDIEILDLSVPRERRKFICFKLGPFFKDSPNRIYSSKTLYDITDHERSADEFLKSRRERKKATEIAEGMQGEALNEFAYALGFDYKLMTPMQLHVEVIKFAENENKVGGKTGSQRFLEAYYSDTRHELTILKRGLSTGIVESTHDRGVTFNNITIGWSEEEAVQYLKNNSSVAVSIDTQSRGRVKASTQVEKFDVAQVKTAEQAEIENLKRKLQQMEELYTKTSGKLAETSAESSLKENDEEYVEMLSEAKSLGIKGPHLIGRTETDLSIKKLKLKEAIDKHKLASEN